MSAVRETLVAARELIADESCWTKGTFWDGVGFCASGAIREAAGWNSRRYRPATRTLAEAAGEPSSLPRWNDAPERTHAEVLAAFDAAIESAAEAERAS